MSALHWEDWDEENGVLRVRRNQVRGKLDEVTRKKRAPKEYPVEPELIDKRFTVHGLRYAFTDLTRLAKSVNSGVN